MAVVRVIQENVLGASEVAFDEHAAQRMQERGVTEAEVLDTLRNPDQTGLPADEGRFRVRRFFGTDSKVDVIYEDEVSRIVVVIVTKSRRK